MFQFIYDVVGGLAVAVLVIEAVSKHITVKQVVEDVKALKNKKTTTGGTNA